MAKTYAFQAAKEEDGFHSSFWLVEFPSFPKRELENFDKKITARKRIEICFDYPLRNKVWLPFKSERGFTYYDFFRCVVQGYKKIYREEGPDPGMIPGMYNRMPSNGKYGIWGHVMSDLSLVSAVEVKPGKFTLGIDS